MRDKSQDLLEAVDDFARAHGYPPSVRDLAAAAGVVVSTAHAMMVRARDRGWLTWAPDTPRSIRLTPQGRVVLYGDAAGRHVTVRMQERSRNSGHVRVKVWAGRDPGHRGLCGELTFRTDEWDELRADGVFTHPAVEVGP